MLYAVLRLMPGIARTIRDVKRALRANITNRIVSSIWVTWFHGIMPKSVTYPPGQQSVTYRPGSYHRSNAAFVFLRREHIAAAVTAVDHMINRARKLQSELRAMPRL